ncbi:hypothetical protein ACFLT7_07990 [candidate division KSB1 bacterium]
MSEQKTEQKGGNMELQSLELMGIFLGVFGLIVMFAMIFADTGVGKIADLLVGGTLLVLGILAFIKGRSHRNPKDESPS